MYGGLTEDDIHALKKLEPKEEISNWMSSEELPTPEKGIKQLEREEQFKLKHKDQPSLFDQPPEENK